MYSLYCNNIRSSMWLLMQVEYIPEDMHSGDWFGRRALCQCPARSHVRPDQLIAFDKMYLP